MKGGEILNKNRLIRILGIAVPVLLAAFGEYSDIMDKKQQEEDIEEMKTRIAKLEQKDSE